MTSLAEIISTTTVYDILKGDKGGKHWDKGGKWWDKDWKDSKGYWHKHKVIAQDDKFSGHQDEPVKGNVLANDKDTKWWHDLDVKQYSQGKYGTVWLDKETGAFKYTPNEGFSGWDAFKYKAVDAYGKFDWAVCKIYIEPEPENKPPVCEDDQYDATEGEKLKVDEANGVLANDDDPEGGELKAYVYEGPEYGELKLKENGAFTYTPFEDNDSEETEDTFLYKVVDEEGDWEVCEVRISIQDNDAHSAPYYELMA